MDSSSGAIARDPGRTTYSGQEIVVAVDGYTVTIQPDRTALLVPPRRLGELLTHRRTEMRQSIAEIEHRSLGRFSAGDLALFEGGEASPTDEQLRHLAGIYCLDLSAITPQRAFLELDLTEGLVSIGGEEERFAPEQDDREILLRYLAIVYRMRAINPGVVVPARNDDLATLALVFSTTPAEMRATLESLMLGERVELRRRHAELKRRVVVPGLGVLVALTTVGGLLLVRHGAGATQPRKTTTNPTNDASVAIGSPRVNTNTDAASRPAGWVDIGSALTINRSFASTDVTVNVDIGSTQVTPRDPFPLQPGQPDVDIGSALIIER